MDAVSDHLSRFDFSARLGLKTARKVKPERRRTQCGWLDYAHIQGGSRDCLRVELSGLILKASDFLPIGLAFKVRIKEIIL